jgi:hypothetical protein
LTLRESRKPKKSMALQLTDNTPISNERNNVFLETSVQ